MARNPRVGLLVLLVPLLALAGPGARAQGEVQVKLEFSALVHHGAGPLLKACMVPVPEGANGKAVLDAAVGRCIDSYQATYFEQYDDWFVDCIAFDGLNLCGTPAGATYWAYFEDDQMADHGIGKFVAGPGREMEFTYTSIALFPLCLTPAGC